MKNIFAITLVTLVVSGCLSEEDKQAEFENSTSYKKDCRTNLCFARWGYGLAEVPCEKVEHLIVKKCSNKIDVKALKQKIESLEKENKELENLKQRAENLKQNAL